MDNIPGKPYIWWEKTMVCGVALQPIQWYNHVTGWRLQDFLLETAGWSLDWWPFIQFQVESFSGLVALELKAVSAGPPRHLADGPLHSHRCRAHRLALGLAGDHGHRSVSHGHGHLDDWWRDFYRDWIGYQEHFMGFLWDWMAFYWGQTWDFMLTPWDFRGFHRILWGFHWIFADFIRFYVDLMVISWDKANKSGSTDKRTWKTHWKTRAETWFTNDGLNGGLAALSRGIKPSTWSNMWI